MSIFPLMRKIGRLLLLIVLGIGALACVIVCLAWSGCASGVGPSRPEAPLSYPAPGAITPKNARFKENVLFLSEAHVRVSEVYSSFGQPDWQSKQLHLVAYRAVNNQALFVVYGTDNEVTRYAVKKLKATDSLDEAATRWLRGN